MAARSHLDIGRRGGRQILIETGVPWRGSNTQKLFVEGALTVVAAYCRACRCAR